MNWSYIFAGLLVAAGGYYVATRRKKNDTKMSFSDYCLSCEKTASQEVKQHDNIVKAILILELDSDENVVPYLYYKNAEGKLMKKRIKFQTYRWGLCPNDVKTAISKGEYILKRY